MSLAYETDPKDVRETMSRTNLRMHVLNSKTSRAGAFGLSALPDKQADARAAIDQATAQPNLRLMLDYYHVALMEGDVLVRLTAVLPFVGHIQAASVPDRGALGVEF